MTKKILLMEDHEIFRRFIGVFLSDHFEVAAAKDPLEAMAWIHKGFIPDCIIAKANTADAGAYKLLQQLQCTGMYANIPVIVIGDKIQQNELDQFTLLGASNYFQKPFNPVFLKNYLLQQLHA
jgi:PleD family two-component response regulator